MRFNVIDIETTGLDPSSDEIVEVGAVKFENGKEIGRINHLVLPRKEISPSALVVNKIKPESLVGCPRIEEVMDSVVNFCGNDLNVGHNFPFFDKKFFDMVTKDHNTLAPLGNIFCTHQLSKLCVEVPKDAENRKLLTLINLFQIPVNPEELHRASADCFYNGLVFLKLMDRAGFKNFKELEKYVKPHSFVQPKAQLTLL